MILKRAIILFSALILLALAPTTFGQEIERNPKFVSSAKAELRSKLRAAYFEVGQEEYIKEWLVIGPFRKEMDTDANAAHHAYPLLRRNGSIQTLKIGGMPLGMMAGIEYTEEQFNLQSGDVLILMTDGIIEARDSKGKDYSESGRLEEIIQNLPFEMSAEAMIETIINDVIDYCADKSQRDARSNAVRRSRPQISELYNS